MRKHEINVGVCYLSLGILLIFAYALVPLTAFAQIASGFTSIASSGDAELYRKNYSNGMPDYVIVTDLRTTSLTSNLGSMASNGIGGGPLGGDNPSFSRRSLNSHWSDAVANHTDPFAVMNGQFFATAVNPTSMAFSVRTGGNVISDGYGITTEYSGQIRLLRVHQTEGYAEIVDFSLAHLSDNRFDEAIAGLDVTADKGPYNYTGRTFAGIRDDDGDGRAETLLFFVSRSARQSDAAGVLTNFGASEQIMFDGGGSSQMIFEDTSYVSSSRTIPHALVLYTTISTNCHSDVPGGWLYCSSDCPCGNLEGDCDEDDECENGLICVHQPGVDYCEVADCHQGALGGWTYCSADCPCGNLEGDCDEDDECESGLTCVHQPGVDYCTATSSNDSNNTSAFTSFTVGSTLSNYVASGAIDRFSFPVRAGRQYTVTMTPSSGDPDLYTSDNANISLSAYQCRPYYAGTRQELCSFTAPSSGTNYVIVHGYNGGNYTLFISES